MLQWHGDDLRGPSAAVRSRTYKVGRKSEHRLFHSYVRVSNTKYGRKAAVLLAF